MKKGGGSLVLMYEKKIDTFKNHVNYHIIPELDVVHSNLLTYQRTYKQNPLVGHVLL